MNRSKPDASLWLCLHFPLLPVEVYSRGDEEPVVILERQRIAFMNEPAAEMGIGIGNSMNTAYTISEQITCFERDEQKELTRLHHLAGWAYQFTPNVTVKAPHSLLLEVSGCLKLFQGLENLKREITNGIEKLAYHCRMSVNGTPQSALCSAEAGLPDNPGPDYKERVLPSLARLPVRQLHVDNDIKKKLAQMGIADCEALFRMPMDGLGRRFGVFFTDYLQRLKGERPDPQKYISEKPRFESDITFLADVSNLTSLVFPLRRLLEELEDYLRGRQLMVNQFTVTLSHRSHPARQFTVFLASPDNDVRMFLTLSQLQLDKISNMPEVDNLKVSARTFFETEAPSGDLFHGTSFQQRDGRTHSKAEEARMVRLINMMTARLGPQACFGLSLANDHRPEAAWQPVRLNERKQWLADDADENPPRPAYLLASPRKLASLPEGPALSGKLELLQGPERIEFGWWDFDEQASDRQDSDRQGKSEANRDYFIARHPSGALYWIYQQRDSNGDWYLHGIFS